MSGIQTHTQDPISPTEASRVNSQTARKAEGHASQPASTTAVGNHGYPLARPGAAAPTPTRTLTSSATHGPPAPQPGATPVLPPPTTTAKPSLPPPPKTGEKPMPPGYYAPIHCTPTKPQPYPPQMAQAPLGPSHDGVPPGSTTSTMTRYSIPSSAQPISLPESAETLTQTSLAHPPGYVQNPYASEMTPAQRRAAQQENVAQPSPSLSYNDSNAGVGAGSGEEEGIWDVATKWARKKGQQAGELHGQVWEKIDELSKGK